MWMPTIAGQTAPAGWRKLRTGYWRPREEELGPVRILSGTIPPRVPTELSRREDRSPEETRAPQMPWLQGQGFRLPEGRHSSPIRAVHMCRCRRTWEVRQQQQTQRSSKVQMTRRRCSPYEESQPGLEASYG